MTHLFLQWFICALHRSSNPAYRQQWYFESLLFFLKVGPKHSSIFCWGFSLSCHKTSSRHQRHCWYAKPKPSGKASVFGTSMQRLESFCFRLWTPNRICQERAIRVLVCEFTMRNFGIFISKIVHGVRHTKWFCLSWICKGIWCSLTSSKDT